MTQYECGECGQLVRFARQDRSEFVADCPACGERTVWTVAFEAEGVSF
ncbi:MAG: hypothetical protein ABEJ78_10745 [Haloferacaceae archaeon]